eukprot:gb/GFBE01017547.1/.p1 GENE.gb/GFBE01017547.1/~~gb/GFBE01017547.1/.p1  ORF type:complete len:184 (+),score=34.93 gb/GFBE01017547.1/:1-552(+)
MSETSLAFALPALPGHTAERPSLAWRNHQPPPSSLVHAAPACSGRSMACAAALVVAASAAAPRARRERRQLVRIACHFSVGEKVECRDAGDEEWKRGRVVSLDPVKVLPEYYEEAFEFDEVRELQDEDFGESIYEVGQRVMCRDSGDEEWKFGKVVSLEPLKVLADYFETPFTYDEVRPAPEE